MLSSSQATTPPESKPGTANALLTRELAQPSSFPKPLIRNEHYSVSPGTEERKADVLEIKQSACNPLSTNSKMLFVAELKKVISTDLFKQALIEAALNNQSFPEKINEKLNTLQQALFQNKDNILVKPHIEQAIIGLVKTEIVAQFKAMLENPVEVEIETLNSAFLYFLAKYLNIEIQQNPIVQATIQDGKIYWKIFKNGREIYYHQEGRGPVSFLEETSWYMDWEVFRAFKDSGKRSSSVAITRDLFVAQFGQQPHIATEIWDDLKSVGGHCCKKANFC